MTEVERLRQEVARLKKALKSEGKEVCPLCGGMMSTSTKFEGLYYCLQRLGYCGEWFLNPRTHSPYVYTAFSRTTIRDGRVTTVGGDKDICYYFIGGKMVTRDEYLQAAGLGDD